MISQTVLVLAEPFGNGLGSTKVASAIGRGLEAEGRLECDICPIDAGMGVDRDARPVERQDTRRGAAPELLDALDFDRRMRAARAVVIACERLDDRSLAGSIAFEAATRARQAGVPAYALTGENALDPFEARIVDLRVILQAGSARALTAAGRRLATLV